MSEQPPMLEYKTPEPKPDRRPTSATTRFACGVGLGFLGFCVIESLSGADVIPIGPAIEGVFTVAISGAFFWIAGYLRKAGSDIPLVERNKFLTVVTGIGCVGVAGIVGQWLPPDRYVPFVAIIFWAAIVGPCNWIAIGRNKEHG